MSKLFVIPDVGGSTSFSCIQCKHPKDGSVCTYYYEPKQNRLYELAVQQNRFYSWFLNNNLNNDGNIYMVTPIDPLFLLIPLIYKETVRFKSLFDICSENISPPEKFELFQKLYPENVLKCVADVKDFEDELFIKYSQEKTLKWLGLKFKNIEKSLISQGIGKNLSGYKVSDYVSGENKLSEGEYKVLAFELISDYIPPDIVSVLRRQLNIPDCSESTSTNTTKAVSNKRKIETDSDHKSVVQSAHTDDACDKQKQASESNKKQKVSRAQRELSKVDKSGMKSIASYFKKK